MKRAVFLAGILALVLMVGPASAAIVIDFEQGSVIGGTITYSGGQAIGVNIPVDLMKVTIGTTDTFYNLFGAGPSSAVDTAFGNLNGSALVNFNTGTGAFTIVGGVCTSISSVGCPGANTMVASTTLVNGTSMPSILAMDSSHLTLVEADTKAASLLSALGLPADIQWTLATAQFNNLQLEAGTANVYTVGSVDIANVAVPEPASIVLLGACLLGTIGLLRRRA